MSRLTTMRISSILILLLVSSCLFSIKNVSATTYTTYLNVNGYNEQICNEAWKKGGVTPYINGTDYPIGYLNASESYAGADFGSTFATSDFIGNFTIEDISDISGKTLTHVYLEWNWRSLGTYSPSIGIAFWDTSTSVWRDAGYEGRSYYQSGFSWSVDFDISSYITSWSEVNTTQIRVYAIDVYASHEATDVSIVDHVRLKIIYDYIPPSWHHVEYWYGTLFWHHVEFWYGIFGSAIAPFFDVPFYILIFGLGSWVCVPFCAVFAIKTRDPKLFITALIFFGIGLALFMYLSAGGGM